MRKKTRNPVVVGGVMLVVISIAVFLGFRKDIPFVNEPYEIKAAFRDTSGMKTGSPVRIAGVEVGKVRKVQHTEPGAREATVTMSILTPGRPIHKDARAYIRPRIFLEGNFFVDLQPGTPSSPEMKRDGVIPVSRTDNPVQFHEVLAILRKDVREQLKGAFSELGTAQEAGAGKAFNATLDDQAGAYRWSAVVSEALLGERPGDLGRLVKATGVVNGAIDRQPERLKTFVTDFNRTARAFADSEGNLRASVRELPVTLREAQPTFALLNEAFPSVRRFAVAARPGIRSTGPAARALVPLVRQLRGLVGEPELRGLARDLRSAIPPTARLARETVPTLEQVRALAGCTSDTLVPFGNKTVPDPNFPASGPVFQETGKALPGLAGESRSFDANGPWFKVLGAGGLETFDLGNGLFGSAVRPVAGVNPPPDRSIPPFRPDVPCETQTPPDLRTNVGKAPSRARGVDPSSKAARERYEEARKIALLYQQLLLRTKGDTTTQVLDQDATLGDLSKLPGAGNLQENIDKLKQVPGKR